jgi:hypothetical protein
VEPNIGIIELKLFANNNSLRRGINMKKLIVLIVVVALIIILLKIIGGRVYLSNDSKENVESDEWKIYNVVLAQGNSQKEVIGANLPKSAQDVHYEILIDTTFTKSYWIVAKLPKEDFDDFTNQLELTNKPDLLKIWPEAFDCEEKRDIKAFWTITKSVDENTYYGEERQIESRIMLKYEAGKLYVKRSTHYDGKAGTDKEVYLKVRRR